MSPDTLVAPEAPAEVAGLTDEETAVLVDLIKRAPSLLAARGPSIHPPGDPHYTWADFMRDSPEAQNEALAQAQQLQTALLEIQDLQKQLAAARATQDPAARAAELKAELAQVEAMIPAADTSGAGPQGGAPAAPDAGGAPVS